VAKNNKLPDADKLIKNYILNGLTNAKQAAIDAHYSPRSAEQSASRVIRSDKGQAAIKAHQEKGEESFIYSKEKKLAILQLVMDNAAEICTEDGNFNKGKMNNHSAVVAAIKTHNEMQGDNAPTESNVNMTSADAWATE